MQISRPDNSGLLDGLEVRTVYAESIDRLLNKGTLTLGEARILRRAGRFQTIRVAVMGRNLYQDIETKEFWEMKEGAVVRLIGVDGDGVIAKEASRAAGGSTGYYRDKRMEQSPGTFNDGAGEKNTDKFAVEDEDEEGLEAESAIGMRPDRDYQEKSFNADEGPGHAQTAAAEKPFEEGEWVTDGKGDEFQVVDKQNPDGTVDVMDDMGNTEKYPLPQDLTRKSQPGAAPQASRDSAWAEGMKDNQTTDLIDFSLIGLPDRSATGRVNEFGFLDEMDVSEVAAVTHCEEMDRIVVSGEITRTAARALRRVGRFAPAAAGMYRDTTTNDLWACDGDMVRRAERARTAASDSKRTATWNTIDSVLRRERGWVPEFQISNDREVSGIHLENPSPDDVITAIHVAREQGHRVVHVH